MRVIAGSARGTPLKALPGTGVTRPTLDRVKEGMFSSVQFLVPGAKVLDLFAGSGQLGIEALSRGAARCTFVECSRQAAAVVRANCLAAGVMDRAEVTVTDAFAFLAHAQGPYDLVLLDPPFGHGTLAKVLTLLEPLLSANAAVLTESEPEAELPEQCPGLTRQKQYRYGKILVTRYARTYTEEEENP